MLASMSRSLRTSLALFVVVLASLAAVASLPIPPEPPPEWAYESELALEVGHFQGPHGVYDEGDPLPLERGFQGGQHVNAQLATAELPDGEEANVVVWVVDPTDERVLAHPEGGAIVFLAADEHNGFPPGKVYAYARVVVENPDSLIGEEVELRAQVTLSDGRVARAWHRGVGEFLPDDWFLTEPDAGVHDDGGASDGGP